MHHHIYRIVLSLFICCLKVKPTLCSQLSKARVKFRPGVKLAAKAKETNLEVQMSLRNVGSHHHHRRRRRRRHHYHHIFLQKYSDG